MDLGRSLAGSESQHRTLNELIVRYLEAHPAQSKDRGKVGHLAWWRERLGSNKLADIRPAMIGDLRDELARRVSAATQNRYLAALSVVYSYGCGELEWCEHHPVKRVKRRKEPRGRVRFLDNAERGRLLEACQESRDPRLHLIVLLAISTGLRQGELMRLRWRDIDFDRSAAVVHETKNDDRRSVPIPTSVLGALREMSLVRRIDDDRVFAPRPGCEIWPESAWRTARDAAALDGFTFHDCRHTAASYLAMSGATLAEIAEVLGHRTLAMVKRYAHLTDQHTSAVVQRMADKFLGD